MRRAKSAPSLSMETGESGGHLHLVRRPPSPTPGNFPYKVMRGAAVNGLLASYDESLRPEFGDSSAPCAENLRASFRGHRADIANSRRCIHLMQTCVAVPNSFTEITSLVGTPNRWVGQRALPALAAGASARSASEVPF